MHQSKEEAHRVFLEFLVRQNFRKTQERFAILDEIYDRGAHFDAETLYDVLKEKNSRVSRATVYNTLSLLEESGVVVKHQFGSNVALYEKAIGYRQHDHLVCIDCKKITEFCDPRLGNIQDKVEELLKYQITNHSLVFYGHCTQHGCANKPVAAVK
jgi:Fur family transcriptional regulator, ferric uptake regulator